MSARQLEQILFRGEFENLDFKRDQYPFVGTIGDNAHVPRREAQIQQWPGWGIEMKGGKIVVTPQNGDGVLSLLNDASAESLIRRQVFGAVVTKPVN